MQNIEIIGASKHNLKNVSLSIPKGQLITITGVSGSGKSSLAFDTIFQEGQRKYLESLSIYARQFIKSLEKPEVRSIKGISPTISIDQKHASFYYNSTVGTISEISQYLRLLFARAATARCPGCGMEIETFSPQQVTDYIFDTFLGEPVYILAPVVKGRKGTYKALFEKYLKRGFLKARVNGKMIYLEEAPALKRTQTHRISIMVDAVRITPQNRRQLEESLTLAAFESHGEIIIIHNDIHKNGGEETEYFFSNRLYCPQCSISLQEPQPATFSLNSPAAVCPHCSGRGQREEELSCKSCGGSGYNPEALAFYLGGKNIHQVGQMEVDDLLHFFRGLSFPGHLEKIAAPILPQIIGRLESFGRLNLGYISLNRKINTLSGGELQRARLVSQIGFGLSGIVYILDEPSIGMHISEQENLVAILHRLKENDNTVIVVEHDAHTINASDYIIDLGPGSGEKGGQIVYAGWRRDFAKATNSLTSDYIFHRKSFTPDLPWTKTRVGVSAGEMKNRVNKPFENKDTEVEDKEKGINEKGVNGKGKKEKKNKENKEFEAVVSGAPDDSNLAISISDISINNIKNALLEIPLNTFTVVTGVSGSGKSSLILDAFYPIVYSMTDSKGKAGTVGKPKGEKEAAPVNERLTYGEVKGLERVKRVLRVTQSAIGKNARSCPATYLDMMPYFRELFAGHMEAKIRGYPPARFSFNVAGGRCEACNGLGYNKLEMSFLPDLEVPCPVCGGKRYNSETLLVKYDGLSIADVLELTADDAYERFMDIPPLGKRIKLLKDVGLGYLKLGQSSVTLSGGESQRIKLCKELARGSGKETVYLLDEPTVGLHFDDIRKLIDVFRGLLATGNTVVVIEHNLEVIRSADTIIDMGPGGGKNGGQIIYQGELPGLKEVRDSITAKYL